MLVIAYSSNPGYLNMVHRLENLCKGWDIPFKAYDKEWLQAQPEYTQYPKIFTSGRGGGYWAWKPLIILDALQYSQEVMYLDSSVVPQSKEAILNFMANTDMVSAAQYHEKNRIWTKRSCFVNMNCDYDLYWDINQVWAGVIAARRFGTNIIDHWKHYCLQYDIISDKPSEDNFPEFKDHRHDQSILTNILLFHGQTPQLVDLFYDISNFKVTT